MTKFVAKQLSQSTAEDARNYFSGASQPVEQPEPAVLQPGTYRVVNGILCQIVPGVPPELADTANNESEVNRIR